MEELHLSQKIWDLIYPIGSICLFTNNINPSTLYGGTWEQIKDVFLLACGNTYANGSTGGSATHKHTFNLLGTKAYTLNSWGLHVIGSSSVDGASNETFNTSTNNNMPPYLSVYVWKRIA